MTIARDLWGHGSRSTAAAVRGSIVAATYPLFARDLFLVGKRVQRTWAEVRLPSG
jgi:hypothetical protein